MEVMGVAPNHHHPHFLSWDFPYFSMEIHHPAVGLRDTPMTMKPPPKMDEYFHSRLQVLLGESLWYCLRGWYLWEVSPCWCHRCHPSSKYGGFPRSWGEPPSHHPYFSRICTNHNYFGLPKHWFLNPQVGGWDVVGLWLDDPPSHRRIQLFGVQQEPRVVVFRVAGSNHQTSKQRWKWEERCIFFDSLLTTWKHSIRYSILLGNLA